MMVISQKSDLKIVSFEPSHSWLKRWSDEGALIIQAGWEDNPDGRRKQDNENPTVRQSDGTWRWYGSRACEGQHESPATARKDAMARDWLEAILQPTDNLRKLAVVVSHWDEDTAQRMADSLLGSYNITRNGASIRAEVVKAIPTLEGEGSYRLMQPKLKPGKTLLFELGHGTTEEWIVDETGFFSGKGTESFAVSKLVETIAKDRNVKAKFLKLGEQEVNREMLAACLRSGVLPNMKQEEWDLLKNKYVAAWMESLKNYLLKKYGTQLQTISNIVLTGGGAALIKDRATKFALIPSDPQTASVRGSYEHYSKVLTNV